MDFLKTFTVLALLLIALGGCSGGSNVSSQPGKVYDESRLRSKLTPEQNKRLTIVETPLVLRKTDQDNEPRTSGEQDRLDLGDVKLDSPKSTVTSFVRCYARWNQIANDTQKKKGPLAALEVADRQYKDLIVAVCTRSVKPQAIAFGEPSAHQPDTESIESLKLDGNKAVVTTKHVDRNKFATDYEYHLERTPDGWRIKSLLYKDPDGPALESL